jgi:acetyl-CoA carboxylase carboxyltransferase component
MARLAEEHKRTAGGVGYAMELDLVDDVIDPATTRRRIADALLISPHRTRPSSRPTEPPGLVPPEASGTHGNIPL